MKAPTLQAYILSKVKVDIETGCWLWSCRPDRYGRAEYEGKGWGAHIASYQAFVGPIPAGLILRHTCDRRSCVNPDHLTPGTKKDNRRDFMERHPRARELVLEAAANGAKGVKRFWENMTLEQRAEFVKKRAEKQFANGGHPRLGKPVSREAVQKRLEAIRRNKERQA